MVIRIVEGVEGARTATGVVVVIDVMRAFTTAAYAFAAGKLLANGIVNRTAAFASVIWSVT